MTNKTAIINIAKSYIKHLKDNQVKVTRAYLFGSQLRGHTHPGSDIDVCVISPQFGHDLIDEMTFLWSLARKIDDRIEPHPLSPKDFAEKYNLLAHEVRTNGVLL